MGGSWANALDRSRQEAAAPHRAGVRACRQIRSHHAWSVLARGGVFEASKPKAAWSFARVSTTWSSRLMRKPMTHWARPKPFRQWDCMCADTCRGPDHWLQSEAGYIDAFA